MGLLVFILLFLYSAFALQLEQLTVEYENNPRGIVVSNPRFSWIVAANADGSTARGASQSAYQIQVSLSKDFSSPYWDSGTVKGTDNTLIPYGGPSLKSDITYYWQVRVWDDQNQPTSWSVMAYFATGLLTKGEWHGKWVKGANSNHNQVRLEFSVDSADPMVKATAFISGIGYYELYINAQKAGDHKLDVGWTNYDYTVLYSTYDVSNLVVVGKNAIGIMLGRGWFSMEGYGDPQAVLQLNILLQSGKTMEIVTDPATWKSSPGPITYDDIYNGETYNAILETPGWTQPNFDDSKWSNAGLGNWGTAATGTVNFSPQVMPAIKEIRTLPAQLMWEPSRGTYVFDFDQNMSGWIRLKLLPLSKNVTITLRHAELLNHDGSGNIYTGNLRSAKATDMYTTRGNPDGEMYEPRFTYHGFRFVEVTGLPYVPNLDTVTAVHVRSSVTQIGNVAFSDPLLNNIQKNILWGQTSNLMSVPTDCDNRDERKGWTGDSALTAEEAALNFNMGSFFTSWLNRIRDVMNKWNTGYICNIVPSEGGPSPPDPAWSSVYPTVAWTLLQTQGDKDVVADHWPTLTRYMDYWYSSYQQTGMANFYYEFGDWVPPPPQPMVSGHYTAAFAYLHDVKLMADMANGTNNAADYNKYNTLFATLKDDFNTAFYDSSKKLYADGGQTAMSLALWLGVVPSADEQTVLTSLVNNVMVTNAEHLTTGIIGCKFLFEALSMYRRTDVGLAVALQTSYPSWGYMIHPTTAETPATTIWELWDSDKEGDGMNSRNHIMFGTVGSWFHRSLGGIWPGPERGYRRITLRPEIYPNISLSYVDDTISTLRGPIRSSWAIPAPGVCGQVSENTNLTLTCADSSAVIDKVIFASFGTPVGDCTHGYTIGSCHATNSSDIVGAACIGKHSCTVTASDTLFGDPCYGTSKVLAAAVSCNNAVAHLLSYSVSIPITSTADVHIPNNLGNSTSTMMIQESGSVIWQNGAYVSGALGIKNATLNGNSIIVNIGSGDYNFDVFA